MGDMDVYPTLLDMTEDECRRILRNLELEAYGNLVSVLRAQGSLSSHKKRLLQSVAQMLSIPAERHKAECRRAVASEKLATIAKYMEGPNTATDWAIEGRRLVPLLPRLVPHTAFTALADQVANIAATEKAKFPPDSKVSTSAGVEENIVEEPSTPEASKTVELCVNPAAGASAVPLLSQSSSKPTLNQMSSQIKTLNSCKPIPVVTQDPNNEEVDQEKVSRKRGRASSVDARSADVFGSVAVQPPSKKFQESVNVSISRPQPVSSVTQPCTQPSQRTALKLPAKSPSFQQKPYKSVEIPDFKISEKVEEQSHETKPDSQPPALASSHIVPPLVTSASGVARVTVPNHVKLSLASPTQSRTASSSIGNAIATPSGTQKVIIVSSTTPSILQRSLSVPLVKAATSNQKQPPVVLNSVPNQVNSQKQQHSSTAQTQQDQPSSKPNSSSQTVLTPQSTPTTVGTTTPTTMAKSSANNATQGSNPANPTSNLPSTGTVVASKFPPKSRPRGNSIVIPMTLNQAVAGGATVSNVQLKTVGAKPTTLHLKQDSSVKIMPITSVGGTKILPKPSSGQMFLVSSASCASPTVSMVTRTVPTGTRVMAVNSPVTPRGGGGTSSVTSSVARPSILSVTSKSGQAVQMGLNSGGAGLSIGSAGTGSKPNVIVVQKSSSGALSRGVTFTQGGKEVVGKVVLGKAGSAQGQTAAQGGRPSVTVQKFTNAAAVLQASVNQNQVNLPNPSSGNVIVLDLSHEQFSNNAVLSEILQGILPSANKTILDAVSSSVASTTPSVTSTTAAKFVKTIEEDTPLPRVSSDWLQTSDITSCVISDNSVGSLDGLPVGEVGDASLDSSPHGTTVTTSASPSVVVQSVVPPTPTTMDIFSTALSSADINLDSFQYLEDSSLDGLATQLGVNSAENSSSGCFVGESNQQSLDTPMDCE